MAEKQDIVEEVFSAEAERSPGRHAARPESAAARQKPAREKGPSLSSVDKLLIDETGEEAYNYTGDEASERDYRPIRQSHEYRSGCLGGIMYFAFILCLGVVLACLAWMAASDMLALNKTPFTTTLTLPSSIFTSETVDTFDEAGVKTGTKRVTHADMDYVAEMLKDAGLIENKWLFKLFAQFSHADTKLKPGEYELSVHAFHRPDSGDWSKWHYEHADDQEDGCVYSTAELYADSASVRLLNWAAECNSEPLPDDQIFFEEMVVDEIPNALTAAGFPVRAVL